MLTQLRDVCLNQTSFFDLIDLVSREVGGVNVGCQAWLEWCPDSAQAVKLDSLKERMRFKLLCPTASKSVLRVANQAELLASKPDQVPYISPSDQIISFPAQLNIIRETQRLPPVHNFPVCVMSVLSTERRPSH